MESKPHEKMTYSAFILSLFLRSVKSSAQRRKETMNIIEYIPHGIKNAVSMTELAFRTGESKRTVRKLIHQARLDGEVICSTCDGDRGGYYIPLTPAEARPFYHQQQARINSSIAAISAVSDYIKDGVDNDRTI